VEKAFLALGGRVEFIGISSEDGEKIGEYLEEYGLSLPVARDEDGGVMSLFGARVPTNVIIDIDGTVIYRRASPPEDIEEYLEKLLETPNI
jgi:peroxiredoxin